MACLARTLPLYYPYDSLSWRMSRFMHTLQKSIYLATPMTRSNNWSSCLLCGGEGVGCFRIQMLNRRSHVLKLCIIFPQALHYAAKILRFKSSAAVEMRHSLFWVIPRESLMLRCCLSTWFLSPLLFLWPFCVQSVKPTLHTLNCEHNRYIIRVLEGACVSPYGPIRRTNP
jgi:hypothetical protein